MAAHTMSQFTHQPPCVSHFVPIKEQYDNGHSMRCARLLAGIHQSRIRPALSSIYAFLQDFSSAANILKDVIPDRIGDLNGLYMTASLPGHVNPLSHLDRQNAPARKPIYRSTKTYDHNEGLSCCFRQWRAVNSHCSLIHGYALAFRFVFATHELDARNWCFDFGGLKPVRAWLHEMFDHTMLVAEDDPNLHEFQSLEKNGLVKLRVMPQVGCEATAQYVFNHVARFVAEQTANRVWLETVEVSEHGGNSAIYEEQ